MNLLLLEPGELGADGRARLGGRRLEHLREVLRTKVGDALEVGLVEGRLGTGRVRSIDRNSVELEVVLDRDPPAPAPLALALALPRPRPCERCCSRPPRWE